MFKSLVVGFALSLLLSLTSFSHAQEPAPLLAFVSTSDDGASISTIRADGSDLHVLTDPVAYPNVGIPYWSPDGSKIAFLTKLRDLNAGVSEDGTPYTRTNLMVMTADGRDVHEIPDGDTLAPPATRKRLNNLDTNLSRVLNLVWSPDSTQIAFNWRRGSERVLLYVANADGSNVRQIALVSTSTIEWTSDSRHVIFEAWGEDVDIFSADVVNGMTRALAHSPTSDSYFDLSPDDQYIVYSVKGSGMAQIFVVRLDGTEPPKQITDGTLYYHRPLWSSDGTQILCLGMVVVGQGGNAYLVNPDGTNLHPISSTGKVNLVDWTPTGDVQLIEELWNSRRMSLRWVDVAGNALPLPDIFASAIMFRFSPDRTLVAFVMDGDDGNRDIYVANPDGSNIRRLTTDPDIDNWPLWQP